ncbi:histidine kinase N-terminal 7TM domain-containing protein [Metabacillus fastidiosus]|uniref:histidine kinase N-terminal 7TM domain-containing diguanylate cyclase n=1 Tax=Metabacillus fastidiosus TaxID=1458 RepID=UPI002E1AC02F|nr:histidine kinase N-terminal 7TM domain-containing protein [Metabacillus fastidiosus]
MNPDIFHYIVIISISGVLSILLAIYAFVKRKVFSNSNVFILISCFSAIYIFGHAFELAGNNLAEIKIWLKFQYFGLPFIAPTCLILILQYTGLHRFLKRKIITSLYIIPIITCLMSLTNDFHHLFYQSVYLRPNEKTPLVDMIVGPLYIVHGSYTFGCLLFGTCILIWYWKRVKAVYWKQVMTLILGQSIPMAASFLYLIGVSPYGMDPVPIVMCFTSALYLWAILSTKLFMIAPIARDRIFESMRDGVLIVDISNRLVDYNEAAEKMIPTLLSSSIGKNIYDIWKMEEDISEEQQKFEWMNRKNNKYYYIHVTEVFNNKKIAVGKTIVLSDVTEQKVLEAQLKQLAYTDGLTKIYNRTYFMKRSQEQLEQAIQLNKSLSLFLFDIDFFKKINDHYGHHAGDAAICHVVELCKKSLQPEYIFGRYGGEEFVVCLPDTNILEAGKIAEKIRAEIAKTPLHLNEKFITITASFGVTEIRENSNTLHILLEQADKALYISKENGRNSVHLAINDSFIIPVE